MKLHSAWISLLRCIYIQYSMSHCWNPTFKVVPFQIGLFYPHLQFNLLMAHKFEVKDILESKLVHNKLYYLVDWLGYTPNDRT